MIVKSLGFRIGFKTIRSKSRWIGSQKASTKPELWFPIRASNGLSHRGYLRYGFCTRDGGCCCCCPWGGASLISKWELFVMSSWWCWYFLTSLNLISRATKQAELGLCRFCCCHVAASCWLETCREINFTILHHHWHLCIVCYVIQRSLFVALCFLCQRAAVQAS